MSTMPNALPPAADWLMTAQQHMEHLRSQLEELDRREVHLNRRFADLHLAQQDFAAQQQQERQQALATARELAQQEAAIARLQQSVEIREAELSQRAAQLDSQTVEIERRHLTLLDAQSVQHDDAVRELELERQQLRQLRESAEEEQRRWRADVETQSSSTKEKLAEHAQQLALERAEQDRLNEQWAAHRKESRRQHLEELEALRQEKIGALEQREKDLQQREIDLQKRVRLHEAHLEQSRAALLTQRSELEQDRQRQRTWVGEVETSTRLRLRQLLQFRDAVGEREQALDAERESFAVSVQKREDELQSQEQELTRILQATRALADQGATLRDRLAGEWQVEISDWREAVADWDALVSDWQATMLQLQAQLASPADQEWVQRVRSIFDSLIATTAAPLQQLGERTTQLTQSLAEHCDLRAELASWLGEREAMLLRREGDLQRQREAQSGRDARWQAERADWHAEREQAERIIRELVQRLESVLHQPQKAAA